MIRFFVHLYKFFRRRKALFYLCLFASVSVMMYFAAQLKYEENISRFFPDTENERNLNTVFDNLRIKDKIIVLFSPKSSTPDDYQERLIASGTQFYDSLLTKAGDEYISRIVFEIDKGMKEEVQNHIYNMLPVLMTDSDYVRMESVLENDGIHLAMRKNYANLLSPAGSILKDFIVRDPLGLAGNSFKQLQELQLDNGFEHVNDHLFAQEGKVLLLIITPVNGMGNTGVNDRLISLIEDEIASINSEYPDVVCEYYGGPSISVYNARQIKADSILTSLIALIIIVAFISLAFKSKATIPLIVSPALFGGLFALCIISIVKGSISAIAVGSGAIVLGIALSYSIHVIVHRNHVSSIEQLIRELAYPLTVGSFTTIGAFLGLLFTSSELLRDFGLFASMSLVGTTLFCLIFLPHFLKSDTIPEKGRFFSFIERINSYRFDKNKWLVGAIVLLTVVCVFTSRRVGFESDMMKINYEPKHIKDTEQKLLNLVEDNKKTVLLVSLGKDMNEAAGNYKINNRKLAALQNQGLINDYAAADYFFVPDSTSAERIQRWREFWTPERKKYTEEKIKSESKYFGFKENTFDNFFHWMNNDFSSNGGGDIRASSLMKDWYSESEGLIMLVSQVQLPDENKEIVYAEFDNSDEVIVFDRSYFTGRWVSAVNNDFYLVLFISSFLIFFTLLLSYGRIELAVISFLPMFISWIIIIGIMGMLGMRFNIVNIILSTFIFGVGDDFSIFIQDGLINKYRTRKSILNGHKTAIFCSAFTIVAGMGVMVFAKHPALHSISLMSILGMTVVVLVSYTVSPIVFRLLISNPASKGLPPHTFFSLTGTLFLYLAFLLGCLALKLVNIFIRVLPCGKRKKRSMLCRCIQLTCAGICKLAFALKIEKKGISKESFAKPSVIIVNHESFLDILFMLSLSPKLVMMTNRWVWNSPFFGSIIRYAGYFFAEEGCDNNVNEVEKRIKEGYSIIIFPEGTRSHDGKLRRFHKGAFWYAEQLRLDITPVILYGAGMIINKKQPFYVRQGLLAVKALERITYDDNRYGATVRDRTKAIARYFAAERDEMYREWQDVGKNPYFYRMLIKNYLYKGPVEEWYIRIKARMENSYRFFDRIVPRSGQITDIGCGYGALTYMLNMLSPDRKTLGIDYDYDKIRVAQCAFLNNNNTQFEYADALEYELPLSDVFVLNDMLHYVSSDKQKELMTRCVAKLKPDGMIIIRDGDIEDAGKQKITRWTEVLSTKVFKFNKTTSKMCFTSSTQLYDWAEQLGMCMESHKNDKYTSNTIFVARRKI